MSDLTSFLLVDDDLVRQAPVLVFFFQAEDGIRDLLVTGVQTCALPLLSSTAEEMQVVIHMNFLSCSTRAATGTHCADEKKPRSMSTFSCSTRRTASLMATSGLLWASA